MVNLTLFEVHLHEGALEATANAPFSGRGESSDDNDDRDDAGPAVPPLLVGGVLVAAAVLAWKLLSGTAPRDAVEVEV